MTHLSIHLAIASTQQSVNVTAAPVNFDTSQTSSVVNIDRDRVEELPIPSRNYLTFVVLGISDSPEIPLEQICGRVAVYPYAIGSGTSIRCGVLASPFELEMSGADVFF